MSEPAWPRSVLIARSAFDVQYEPALNRALNELGVSSRIVETHQYIGGGLLGRLQERVLWGPGLAKASRELLRGVREEKPDVVLFYQGHHYSRPTVAAARAHAFIAGIHNDDPFGPRRKLLRYRLLLKALPLYHGYHVYRDCNVPELQAWGVPRVKVLMSFYVPWLDFPRDLDQREMQRWGCELAFAGHPEPDMRTECIARTVRAGIAVKLYGPERFWRKWLPPDVFRRLAPLRKVFGEDYRKALCGAKMVACFLSKWNRDQYTRRAFEIPACGAFLLAERTPLMRQLYEEGREAEYFDSPEEFLDKVRFYRDHDQARRKVAQAGCRRATTSPYDVYSRMRQWLGDVSQWRREMTAGAAP